MKSMKLALENRVALQIIQALLGLVSKEMRAISFEISESEIFIYFLYGNTQKVIEEDIEDIRFELDVLTDAKYLIKCLISGDSDIRNWPGFGKRMVYRERE